MSKTLERLASIALTIIALVFFLSGLAAQSIGTLSVSVFILWTATVLSGLSQKNRNIIYIFFLISFFVFLLSRVMVRWLENQEIYAPFGKETMIMTYICLFLSLAGLYLGSFGKYRLSIGKTSILNQVEKIEVFADSVLLRKISGTATIICGFATIAVVLERVAYWGITGSGGDLRISFGSALPGIVLRFSYIYVLMLCIFLATLPDKKSTVPILLQYLVCNALKMIYGSRSDFILGLMFIAVYYVIRDRLEEENETKSRWFGRGEKLFTIISIPFLVILIVFIGFYRTHISFEFTGLYGTMISFFESQGTSIDILGYTQNLEEKLPQPHFLYMFDRTYEFLSANPLIGMITGKVAYSANTVERALYGTSLGQTLYYNINRVSFLAGYGCGSSYIAEIWVGFGYLGVFIWNYILSRIMFRMNEYKFTSFIPSVITLVYLQSLFFMPRAGFDSFIDEFASITHIFAMILLWVIYKLLKTQKAKVAFGR